MKRERITLSAAIFLTALLAQTALAEKTVAHITVHKTVREGPRPFTIFGDPGSLTLRRYVVRLAAAARDTNIDAVAISIDQPELNWSQVYELRAAVERIRKAGKPVWFYLEQADSKHYLLATAGDHVYLSDGGGLALVGVDATMVFVKGLMDKLGVRADVVQAGKFKGAAEPFTQTQPSEELLGQVRRLVDGQFEQLVAVAASSRRIEPARMRELIDRGPFLAQAALEARLIDRVGTRAEMLADMQKRLGGAVTVRNNYGLSQAPSVDLSSPLDLIKLLMTKALSTAEEKRIGLVYIDGVIASGRSEDGLFGGRSIGSDSIRTALDRARTDDGVAAVVLRIDSPGGSAIASDVIWQAVRRLAQTKPVVVSVGGMAASGGYYIASAGPTILAEPASIVGSIGVVGGKVVLGGLFDKVGINTTIVSRGQHATMFNIAQPFTDPQRARVEQLIGQIYQTFLDRITTGRGEKIQDIKAVAEGRVFLGETAHKNGLIDRIGGLGDAIALAAGQAKIEAYQVEIMPAPKTLLDVLREVFDGGGDGSLQISQRALLGGDDLELIARLMPRQLRLLSRQLIMLNLLSSEQVLTAWPVACELN